MCELPQGSSAASPQGSSALLPHRLVAAARLLVIDDSSQLSELPVARADEQLPLSAANERAALALLSHACEEALEALGGPLAHEEEENVPADGAPSAPDDSIGPLRKRKRVPSLAQMRAELGQGICVQQRKLYSMALAEIQQRQGRLS